MSELHTHTHTHAHTHPHSHTHTSLPQDGDERTRLLTEAATELANEVVGEKKKKRKKKKKSSSDKTAETQEQPPDKSTDTLKREPEKVEENKTGDTSFQANSIDERERLPTPDDGSGCGNKKTDEKEDILKTNEHVQMKAGATDKEEDEVKIGATDNGDCIVPSGDNGDCIVPSGDKETTVEESVNGVEQPSGEDSEPKQQQKGEEPTVAKDTVTTTVNVKKKLHLCACCGKEETTPKTFKRCQK